MFDLTTLSLFKIIPVIAIDRVDQALPLADALIAGGLPAAEITFRTAAAAEVIATLSRERPQMTVGAGTLLTTDEIDQAIAAGAKFGVAPGLNPRIVTYSFSKGLPFVPGIASPSEIEQGLDLGCRLLKFFPAEAIGGIKLLKAFSAPYKMTGVRFMPTGGINLDNLNDYLSVPQVAAVGGTWLAKKDDLDLGHWSAITDKCRAAAAKAR